MKTILLGALSGLIAGIGSFIAGSVLWLAPWAIKINNNAADHELVRFFKSFIIYLQKYLSAYM